MPLSEKQSLLVSLGSGLVFSVAWLFFVDGYVISRQKNQGYTFKHWTPGLVGSIGFVMINMVNPDMLNSNGGIFDEQDATKAKAWFFFSTLVAFTGLVLAIWLMIELMGETLYPDGKPAPVNGSIQAPYEEEKCSYCGVALLLQAFLLMVSSFMFFGARGKNRSDYDAIF
eukprot:TRINITY_DN3035_c0_g1_i1.p2 TRINITY_DN3035_c0_g1~~TRINITY_DN3035_c0_g1_i1.p2  ORF type:complete len:199 (+),score=90.91 TRINITY_DN3035_c0_g1_i1:89-598(+)